MTEENEFLEAMKGFALLFLIAALIVGCDAILARAESAEISFTSAERDSIISSHHASCNPRFEEFEGEHYAIYRCHFHRTSDSTGWMWFVSELKTCGLDSFPVPMLQEYERCPIQLWWVGGDTAMYWEVFNPVDTLRNPPRTK